MKRPSDVSLLVYCILSDVVIGCAEQGKVFDIAHGSALSTTFYHLVDGDRLAVRIQIPDERRPISVSLAKISWTQGERVGVELLVMDVDERLRLNRFLEVNLPLEL